jgi:PIN domain nuclease of toxin-antitoxin system
MNLLLDTHTLIWYAEGSDRLSSSAESEIRNPVNIKFISITSLWEIAIKSSRNKLELKQSFVEVIRFLEVNNMQILDVKTDHLKTLLTLPYNHNDPFGRLIISQAISENMTIISTDKHFNAYNISIIW